MMYALARLAGLAADIDGWTISPGIPHDNYSFSCSLFGIDSSPEKITGYVILPVSTMLKLKIELPGNLSAEKVFVEGRQVPYEMTGNTLDLSLSIQKGGKTVWNILTK
jgi:hypothetical protein